uniref:RING-type domain-containing protein n=1 Tax=Kalanchoe fedtschenkoi TaxID=63787 RepID=A0A7N0VI77_KALFE
MRIAEGGRGTMRQTRTSCYRESIRALEADVQHANALAAGLPTDHDGDIIQIRLSYSPFAPLLVRLIEWLDYSCTDRFPSYLGLLHILVYKVYVDGTPSLSSQDRKASLSEFYVIYPSLMLLQEDIQALKSEEAAERYGVEQFTKHLEKDSMREDECTICMDSSNKIVLPSCAHSMCSNCFHDWNWRSQTCPFCRGSLESIEIGDLWVLTGTTEVIDTTTLAKQNLWRFYRFIDNLPLAMPDNHLFIFDYLI